MFETKNIKETLQELNVDPKQGLTTEEAGKTQDPGGNRLFNHQGSSS